MTTPVALHHGALHRTPLFRACVTAAKRIFMCLLAVYLIPKFLCISIGLGLVDFARNRTWDLSSLVRYFAGNGVLTWLLSPFNLLMDLISLPYCNKGIYRICDLPKPHQAEINTLLAAVQRSALVETLNAKLGDNKRGMIFFKWYGKNVETSVDVPEFHRDYKFIRTIGVSIFNTHHSAGLHFGPLRMTLRVLYNINRIDSDNVYIRVGQHTNYWRTSPLFIFDDTLQHESINESDEVRYCMFIDILRPCLFPGLMSVIVSAVRITIGRFNSAFYKRWTFFK